MVQVSAHPGESRDPVLWVLQRIKTIRRSPILKRRRQAGQNWVPAFAGMSGEKNGG
ncbi:hypothetical protein [Brevundimonas sp.]|uniref:hypothetical protein n=1 Tax=Brevundimonas sp. TaxID=1871086 RepID=UPI00391D1B2E